MKLRPFFSYYGAKHRTAALYPEPLHETIVEPFAGSAAYACMYPERRVVLVDKSPIVAGVWRFLIGASAADILALPLLAHGQHVDTLDVCQEARWLIGFWCNHATDSPRKTLAAFAREKPNNYWGAAVRQRIAEQVERINHWTSSEGSYEALPDAEATYFVDPPYVGRERVAKRTGGGKPVSAPVGDEYPYGARGINYAHLGEWCRSRRGQVVACENYGATWLPFVPFVDAKSSRGVSREVIWTNRRPRATQLPLSIDVVHAVTCDLGADCTCVAGAA